jgi:hypothetical protein
MSINVTNWANNWVSGMAQAGTALTQGVQSVTVAPGVQAAAKKDKMKANWLASMADNSWEQAVSGVTLQQWQQAMLTRGAQRMADGAQAAKPKVMAYAQKAAPLMAQLQAQIDAMPDNTPQDAEQRMLAWSRGMREMAPQLQV